MDALCNCMERSQAATVDPSERARVGMDWAARNVHTGEIKKLLQDMAMAAPAERVKLLRAAADKAGMKACPLADEWAQGLSEPPKVNSP